jgi:hypothetical protein
MMPTKQPTRKQRFQVMLEPGQIAALRKVEARTGAPLAVQIRRAVETWLKTQGETSTPVKPARRQR